jgi:hypothetical protein
VESFSSSVSLKEQAQAFVRGNRKLWPEIQQRTEMSLDWLQKFSRGRIQNPGVNQIEKILAMRAEQEQGSDPVMRADHVQGSDDAAAR